MTPSEIIKRVDFKVSSDITKNTSTPKRISKFNEPLVSFKMVAEMTQTAKLLKQVLDDNDQQIVDEFDKARKNFKNQKSKENKEVYQCLVAKLETKLLPLYDRLYDELHEIELECFGKKGTVPSNIISKKKHDALISKLKKIKTLRKELHI